MIRICTAALLVMLLFQAVMADEKSELAKARRFQFGGKYTEAIDAYRPFAAKTPAAALGLARCLAAQGKTDEAAAALKALADNHAEVQAELAWLAFGQGQFKEAQSRAEAAVHLAPQQLEARFVLAELARVSGRLDEAERGYQRLVDYYNNHQIDKVESLLWIGRGAAQYARWKRLSDQFDFLVNDLYPDALKLDPSYWPAHYEAGLLFLEKYNQADATKEFQAALELNPCAAEVHAAMAALAIENHDFDKAQASLGRALEINPRLLEAWHLKSDLTWANLQVQQTLELLQAKVLPLNPVDEETLGRIAACYLLLDGEKSKTTDGKTSRFASLVAEVTGRNPHAGQFFETIATMLEDRNKQNEAESYFREAIRVMPRQAGPHAGLGMLYMRTGQEAEARKLLTDAFEADPFHVRVKNTLEVLDVLDTMKTLTTEHFIIKYAEPDKLLAQYAAKQLEPLYEDMCKQYGYRPPHKTLVEIFNEANGNDGHSWFSSRMIGLPYLGTVAASTGRIVAMCSPNETGSVRPFNWSRVLRHEMVHVFNLQQTQFNIPHWFTEGLAVRSEQLPRPYRWNVLLRKWASQGKLFRLDTVNLGFTRSMSGDDCQMAYCQSLLYVEYMLSRGGPDVLSKMLAAYTDNPTTADAIHRVFGISQEEFEQGYVAYVKKLVAGLPTMPEPPGTDIDELLKAHRDRPKDANAAARLAYGYLEHDAEKEAREMAELALRLKPKQPMATYVVARLRLHDKHPQEAMTMLEGCLDRQSPDPLVLELLADLKFKEKQYDDAATLYGLGERLDPSNPKWIIALARVYLTTDKKPALAETLTRLAHVDGDDLPSRKKLAELAMARRDAETAARWARQAMEINIADPDTHRLLAEALVELHEYDKAITEFEIAIEQNPKNPQQRFALADACVQAKQTAKAREALEALLKLAPDYPGAEMLLESLKKSP